MRTEGAWLGGLIVFSIPISIFLFRSFYIYLYPSLLKVLNYDSKIDWIVFPTSGTNLPSDDICKSNEYRISNSGILRRKIGVVIEWLLLGVLFSMVIFLLYIGMITTDRGKMFVFLVYTIALICMLPYILSLFHIYKERWPKIKGEKIIVNEDTIKLVSYRSIFEFPLKNIEGLKVKVINNKINYIKMIFRRRYLIQASRTIEGFINMDKLLTDISEKITKPQKSIS